MKKAIEIITFGLGPFIMFWSIVLMTGCDKLSPSPKNVVDTTMMVGYVYDMNSIANDNNNVVIYVRNGLVSKMYVVVSDGSINVGDSIVHEKRYDKTPIVTTDKSNCIPIK